jgi:DNA-binding transcriptional LysR family regulator
MRPLENFTSALVTPGSASSDFSIFGRNWGRTVRHCTAEYPGIEIEMAVGNEALNLSWHETAIALRIGNTPPETLVGRRDGWLDFAIYGSPAYYAGRPGLELARQNCIGLDSAHAPLVRRFEQFLPGVRPVILTNSAACAVRLAKAGLGLAVLPCAIAEQKLALIRVAEVPDTFSLGLWLLTHEDLRRTARVRAVLDFLATALAWAVESASEGGAPL